MKLLSDESAQSITIVYIIFGIFIMGLAYIMLGVVMNENQKANNDLISNSSLPYSQKRATMMTGIYDYFWAFPIYILLLFIVYGIKKSIDKQSGEI